MFERNVLDRFGIFKKKKKSYPKHIALTVEDNILWQKKNKKSQDLTFLRRDEVLVKIIELQVKMNIPIITFFLLPNTRKTPDEIEYLVNFFEKLINPLIHDNEVKISVLGKWYDLPGRIVEEIKHCIDETKNYDRFFLNFCVNYDGQSEIVDACKLISRKIKANQIEIDQINKEMIKENLYSSYFLPPDIIIKTGIDRTWPNFLIWDLPGAQYFFLGKAFNDLSSSDVEKAILNFNP